MPDPWKIWTIGQTIYTKVCSPAILRELIEDFEVNAAQEQNSVTIKELLKDLQALMMVMGY
jgi:hypothetical protein